MTISNRVVGFISEGRAARLLDVAASRFSRMRLDGVVVPAAEVGGRRLYLMSEIENLKNADPLELLTGPRS